MAFAIKGSKSLEGWSQSSMLLKLGNEVPLDEAKGLTCLLANIPTSCEEKRTPVKILGEKRFLLCLLVVRLHITFELQCIAHMP
jgi:hypothetical protein